MSGVSDIWARERRIAEQALRLHELSGIFDSDAERRAGTCLPSSEELLRDGMRLMATDLEKDGQRVLKQAFNLASIALEMGEMHVYNNHAASDRFFVRYLLERVRYFAKWLTGEDFGPYFSDMVVALRQAIVADGGDVGFTKRLVVEPNPGAHYALHLCEDRQWKAVADLADTLRQLEDDYWSRVLAMLLRLGQEMSLQGSGGLAKAEFCHWLAERKNVKKWDEPFDPELTWPEMLSLSRVFAYLVDMPSSPGDIARSLRS